MNNTITVKDVVRGLNLEVIAGADGLKRSVTNPSISKPGLELAGMFDFYEHDRIQVIGSKEGTYYRSLSSFDQKFRTRILFEKQPPAFVFSKNVAIPAEFLALAEEFHIPVLKSSYKTSSLFSELFNFLQASLAERTQMHGVLMDINGVGVVITGKSGIGKSEVALELIRRGYMLVADDIVEIYQKEKGVVIGEAPELLKRYLEIRGIGIVNVVYLFGVKAFLDTKQINVIVNLETWDENHEFNRLGMKEDKKLIFDTEILAVSLPITEARNVATLVEAAAYDFKAKQMGQNSALDFNDQLNQKILANAGKTQVDE